MCFVPDPNKESVHSMGVKVLNKWMSEQMQIGYSLSKMKGLLRSTIFGLLIACVVSVHVAIEIAISSLVVLMSSNVVLVMLGSEPVWDGANDSWRSRLIIQSDSSLHSGEILPYFYRVLHDILVCFSRTPCTYLGRWPLELFWNWWIGLSVAGNFCTWFP